MGKRKARESRIRPTLNRKATTIRIKHRQNVKTRKNKNLAIPQEKNPMRTLQKRTPRLSEKQSTFQFKKVRKSPRERIHPMQGAKLTMIRRKGGIKKNVRADSGVSKT